MIEGKAAAEFGVGDIRFYAAPYMDNGVAMLFKDTKEPREPGLYNDPDAYFDPEEADIIMAFPSFEYAQKVLDSYQHILNQLKGYVDLEKEENDGKKDT